MRRLLLAASAALLALSAGSTFADETRISFPQGYTSWPSFGAIDRYDRKSVRTFYVNPDALAKSMAGQPAPDGTVLVMDERKARLGADGSPERDAEGRFLKTDEVMQVAIQANGPGWGAEYGPEKQNRNWEYANFKGDGSRIEGLKYDACFTCHLNRKERDYTFVFAKFLQDRPR